VSIGSGGQLTVGFLASRIANSGDSRVDLRVIDIGGFTEAFFLELRPALPTTPQNLLDLGLRDDDQDGFFEFGRTGGSGNFDLDARFGHAVPAFGLFFDAAQITDDPLDHPACTSSVGADIDAIIAQEAWLSVEPAAWGSVKALYRD
jgi:hypothetical protein